MYIYIYIRMYALPLESRPPMTSPLRVRIHLPRRHTQRVSLLLLCLSFSPSCLCSPRLQSLPPRRGFTRHPCAGTLVIRTPATSIP